MKNPKLIYALLLCISSYVWADGSAMLLDRQDYPSELNNNNAVLDVVKVSGSNDRGFDSGDDCLGLLLNAFKFRFSEHGNAVGQLKLFNKEGLKACYTIEVQHSVKLACVDIKFFLKTERISTTYGLAVILEKTMPMDLYVYSSNLKLMD